MTEDRFHRLIIISGGQTGVDRAALDAAIDCGTPVQGWCPAGRRTEAGPLPHRYPLRETPSPDYAQRTSWNVRDSDGTLILSTGPLTGGTALTEQQATELDRPLLILNLSDQPSPGIVVDWLEKFNIRRLNVAGPRAGESPGIYKMVYRFMCDLLTLSV